MKKGKKLVLLLTTILMLLGEVGINSTVSNPTTSVMAATRKPKRSTKKYSRAKIWTGDYKIVGNKKSKIFYCFVVLEFCNLCCKICNIIENILQ